MDGLVFLKQLMRLVGQSGGDGLHQLTEKSSSITLHALELGAFSSSPNRRLISAAWRNTLKNSLQEGADSETVLNKKIPGQTTIYPKNCANAVVLASEHRTSTTEKVIVVRCLHRWH